MSPANYAFFFYGTLMDPKVLEIVIGENYTNLRQQPGILGDFKRSIVKGADYPAIIPSRGNQVDGIFVEGISTEGKACLDDFEDDDYRYKRVNVSLSDGREVCALVYIAGPEMLLEDRDWNMNDWKVNHRLAFLKKLKLGMKVY